MLSIVLLAARATVGCPDAGGPGRTGLAAPPTANLSADSCEGIVTCGFKESLAATLGRLESTLQIKLATKSRSTDHFLNRSTRTSREGNRERRFKGWREKEEYGEFDAQFGN